MKISFHEITEKSNNRSIKGSYKLDLIATPNLTSKITQLPLLNQKGFLRDLLNGNVKHICVLVAEDEYISDILSTMVFSEDERVLSSSPMDESVLVRYTSQSWESLKANPLDDVF